TENGNGRRLETVFCQKTTRCLDHSFDSDLEHKSGRTPIPEYVGQFAPPPQKLYCRNPGRSCPPKSRPCNWLTATGHSRSHSCLPDNGRRAQPHTNPMKGP